MLSESELTETVARLRALDERELLEEIDLLQFLQREREDAAALAMTSAHNYAVRAALAKLTLLERQEAATDGT